LLNSSEFGEQFFSTFTRFHRIQAIWQKPMGDNLTRRVAISTGPTKLNFSAPPNATFDLNTILTAARVDWTWSKSEKFALVYGLDAQSNTFEVDVLFPVGNNQVLQNSVEGRSSDVAGYVEARYSPRDNVQVISGLRTDYFGSTDSMTIDPRLLMRWNVDVNTSIKGGAGLFHQAPQPQEVDPVFGNPDINPQYSTQYVLGLEKALWDNRINIDTSVFYKGLSSLVSQNGTGNSLAEITTNDGQGRVYGLEFLLRYPPSSRFFGWVAYSLSRAERRDSKDDPYFLFDFDQTHVLTLLGSYKLGRDFSFGGRVRYATGNPQTPVVGAIFDADSGFYSPISGERNSERVPAFSQIDLRLDKDWRSASWKLGAYIEVLNILNRKNPEGSFYNFDFTQQQFFNSLPILPTIGVRGEF
jgi:outer membrane receptor for ferrienterochelin and colicin